MVLISFSVIFDLTSRARKGQVFDSQRSRPQQKGSPAWLTRLLSFIKENQSPTRRVTVIFAGFATWPSLVLVNVFVWR